MATSTDSAYDRQLDPGAGLVSESYRKESALQKSSDALTPFDVVTDPGEAGVWAIEGIALVRADSEQAAQAQAGGIFGSSPVKVRPATQKDLDAQVKARDDAAAEQAKADTAAAKAAEKDTASK